MLSLFLFPPPEGVETVPAILKIAIGCKGLISESKGWASRVGVHRLAKCIEKQVQLKSCKNPQEP